MTGCRGAAAAAWLAWALSGCGSSTPAGLAATPATPTSPGATTPAASSAARFDIVVRFVAGSTPGAAREAVFADARARWERVVTGDLPDVPVTRPAGTCGSSSPIHETIDDLAIFVTIEDIDGPGGVLGVAGPCMVRSGSALPLAGAMRLDAADLAALESNGLLDDVVFHEMGHVLGIGTLWKTLGLLADAAGSGGVDPHFTGAAALAAFDAIGGSGYAGQRVPVEDRGPAGTRDAHWRESVFDREAMTGWIDPGQNPLGLVTIASLEDLGYEVDRGEARPVSLVTPSVVPRFAPAGPSVRLAGDASTGPIEVVGPTGRRIRVLPR